MAKGLGMLDVRGRVPERIEFTPWVRWRDRRSLLSEGRDFDRDFLLCGVYMLAHIPSDIPLPGVAANWREPRVAYIGQSTSLGRRPTPSHEKVVRFQAEFRDSSLRSLCCTVFHAPMLGVHPPVLPWERACLQFVERKLIWEHIYECGKFPKLNKS